MSHIAVKETRDCFFSSLVLSELQTVFDRIRSSSTTTPCPSKIDPKSLSTFLRSMQYKPKSGEVQEAIWEIDEDHDGKLSWEEFHRACERCISDSQAREPQQVYNYILFVIFSRSSNVLVESELRRLLHLRYGKDQVAFALTKGFGQGPYDICLEEFIRGMNRIHRSI